MGHYEPIPARSDKRMRGYAGPIVAVVVLAVGSGISALAGLLVLPFAGDGCDPASSSFICTSAGQQAVILFPLLSAAAATLLAAGSLALPQPFRGAGIAVGYLIAVVGFLTAVIIAAGA